MVASPGIAHGPCGSHIATITAHSADPMPPDLRMAQTEAEKSCVPPTTTVASAGVMASELAGE